MQLTELSTRLDTVESSIKKDIRNILEILQQQQQQQQSITGRQLSDEISDKSRNESPQQIDGNRLQRTQQTSYQRSENDFSFEQPQTQPFYRLPTASTSQVHRSISQPECTNTATDKSLLRFVSCYPRSISLNKIILIDEKIFWFHIHIQVLQVLFIQSNLRG